MDGVPMKDDQEFASDNLTLVLVGKTGNGKSATGNSILGTTSFVSRRSSSGVTTTSEWKTKTLEDGRILNIIDTPGMFDSFADPEFIQNEIMSCVNLAKDELHAVLVVFSLYSRFSEEENAVISSLVALFGSKIYDYMVIVFTGGDALEDGKSLEDFLCDCPQQLKEILVSCGNRCVLFNNMTKDEGVKSSQIQELFTYVNMVLEKNNGEPYTNEMFADLKNDNVELLEKTTERFKALQVTEEHADQQELLVLIEKMHEELLEQIMELFKSKFIEMQMMLQKPFEGDRAACVKVEKKADKVQKKSAEEIVVIEGDETKRESEQNEQGQVRRSVRERKVPTKLKD